MYGYRPTSRQNLARGDEAGSGPAAAARRSQEKSNFRAFARRHLEHQFRAFAPGTGRAPDRRTCGPDVICLQETKTIDDTFPREAFAQMGYKHQHICGMKSYNGVAIVSRVPLTAGIRATGRSKRGLPPYFRDAAERHRGALLLCAGGRRYSRPQGQPEIRA